MAAEYMYDITCKWSGIGIEAKSEKELIEKVKDIWLQEHNIELSDNEISNVQIFKREGLQT